MNIFIQFLLDIFIFLLLRLFLYFVYILKNEVEE